jgi:hypothetical protein
LILVGSRGKAVHLLNVAMVNKKRKRPATFKRDLLRELPMPLLKRKHDSSHYDSFKGSMAMTSSLGEQRSTS